MKHLRLAMLTSAWVTLAPLMAFAQEQAEEHTPAPLFGTDFVYAVINFGLLLALLIYFLRKPLKDFLLQRRDQVRKAVEEAREATERAEKLLAEYKTKMASADTEIQQLRLEIAAAGERERELMLTTARHQAEQIVTDAKLIGEQEVRRAQELLRAEVAKLASELAEKSLQQATAPADQEKQLNEFLSKLEALS